MPSSTSKSLTRNEKLRQNISVKKLYTKGKRFRRGGGYIN